MPLKTLHFENKNLDYDAWIVIDSLNGGMAFGGCRFSKTVNQAEVTQLADCMTKKLSFHGLPTGGAKAGMRVDTSREDFSMVLKDFASQASEILSTQVMIGKDLGATDMTMDSIYNYIGVNQTSLITLNTGKPVPPRLRDFSGYIKHMTAQGIVWATSSIMGLESLKSSRVVIQGAGAVGLGLLFRLEELGAKVYGMSDSEKALISETALSYDEMQERVQNVII